MNNKIYSMLRDIQLYKISPEELYKDCVEKRLNKSLFVYQKEVEQKLDHLSYKLDKYKGTGNVILKEYSKK